MQARFYDFSSRQWDPITRLQEGGGDARLPSLAMSRHGHAVAAWGEGNMLALPDKPFILSESIRGRIYRAGVWESPAVLLGDGPIQARGVMDAGINDAGEASAVLLQMKPDSPQPLQIFLNRFY